MFLSRIFNIFKDRKKDPHLTIRFTTPADQKRILNFYRQNQHKHVDQRKADLWNERTENGRVVTVADNEDNIGFVSVAYDFEHDGDIRWIEIGSTINQQDPSKKPYEMIKGITLYPFVVASQVINEFLTTTPEDKIIANIYDDNPAVIHMLNNRVGWDFFEPEEEILNDCKATKEDKNVHGAKRLWLTATTNTLPHQARLILKMIDEGTTTGLFNKNSRKYYRLDVSSFSLANEFRAAVEALAYGPVAQNLEGSPHMGMRAARDYLEKHLKAPLQLPAPD